MSDDEIIELAGSIFNKGNNAEAVAFARAIAAKERAACAEICDRFQARDVGMQPAECASDIRARGE